MDTFSNHSTHSLSFIECEVASNKVVSTRKAHVEIPKVEMFGMREGRKGERLEVKKLLSFTPTLYCSQIVPVLETLVVWLHHHETRVGLFLYYPPTPPNHFRLSYSSAVYPFFPVGSVWHLHGPRQRIQE